MNLSTLFLQDIFHVLCHLLISFFKINIFRKIISEISSCPTFCRARSDLNCLQRLSADDNSSKEFMRTIQVNWGVDEIAVNWRKCIKL